MSSLEANSQSHRSSARIRSLQGKGADSIPISAKFALKPGDYCLATRLRLGCEMPIRHATSTCECGQVIDGDGYQLMTCKTGGGPVWTHEALVNTWSDCLQQLNISHRTATVMIDQILWPLTLTLVATLS